MLTMQARALVLSSVFMAVAAGNYATSTEKSSLASDKGTSIASPQVTGLGAYLLGQDPGSPRTTCETIQERATKITIT
jgi:hypothetical protein